MGPATCDLSQQSCSEAPFRITPSPAYSRSASPNNALMGAERAPRCRADWSPTLRWCLDALRCSARPLWTGDSGHGGSALPALVVAILMTLATLVAGLPFIIDVLQNLVAASTP